MRSIMSNILIDTVHWIKESYLNPKITKPKLVIISEGPNSELLFYSSILSDECLVLSDSGVEMYQTEIANPMHTSYWEGLLDQFFICRESLLEKNMILCPAYIKRTVGRINDIHIDYSIDLTCSNAIPNQNFFGNPQFSRNNDKDSENPQKILPIFYLRIPIFEGLQVNTLQQLLNEETDSFNRLKFVVNKLNDCSHENVLKSGALNDIANSIEYEISQIENQYKSLLVKREKTLASAGLGYVGILLSVSFPESFGELAPLVCGATSGLKSLHYVYSFQEDETKLKSNDYYFAWKAWKSKSN